MDFTTSIFTYICAHPLQVLGTLVGVLYLVTEIKASQWMWLWSIVMPIINLFVYYQKGLYADFAIDIYYVIIAVYGFCAWKWGDTWKKHKNSYMHGQPVNLRISHTPRRAWPVLIGAAAALWFAIRWILISFTDSTVPTVDSFTTALSIVAMVMLARKWIEQWWVWAVVDAVSVGLYFYKGLYGYAGLYVAYTVMAFYGYWRWSKKFS